MNEYSEIVNVTPELDQAAKKLGLEFSLHQTFKTKLAFRLHRDPAAVGEWVTACLLSGNDVELVVRPGEPRLGPMVSGVFGFMKRARTSNRSEN